MPSEFTVPAYAGDLAATDDMTHRMRQGNTMVPASVRKRILAFLIDSLCIAVPGVLIWIVFHNAGLALVVSAEIAVAILIWQTRRGLTVGNSLLGLRTIQNYRAYAPMAGQVATRGAMVLIGTLLAGIGQWVLLASCAWDKSRLIRTYHDKVSHTLVIDINETLVLHHNQEHGPHVEQAMNAVDFSGYQPSLEPGLSMSDRQQIQPNLQAQPPGAQLSEGLPAQAPLPVAQPAQAALPAEQPSEGLPPQEQPREHEPASRRKPRHRKPREPIPAESPQPVPDRFALRGLTDDQQISLPGSIAIIGRAPTVVDDFPHAIDIAVSDPTRTVSKNHLLIDTSTGTVHVMDLNSTNGTSMMDQSNEMFRLVPREWIQISQGTTLMIGSLSFVLEVHDG